MVSRDSGFQQTIDHAHGHFYILANDSHKNSRFARVSDEDPFYENWETLIEISITYSKAISPNPYGKLALADSYLLVQREEMAFNIFDQLFSDYSHDSEKLKRFMSKLIYHNKSNPHR